MATCLSIAKGENMNTCNIISNYFDTIQTSLDLQDVYQVIYKDMTIRKNNTIKNPFEKLYCVSLRSFREKLRTEIEMAIPMIYDYKDEQKLGDDFKTLIIELQSQHSNVCRFVTTHLHKIHEEIGSKNSEIYDYSYIVNLLWSYRYVYAVKLFRERIGIDMFNDNEK